MSKVKRAIEALREAADALEDIPSTFRRVTYFGHPITIENLRAEANHIEMVFDALDEGLDESIYEELKGDSNVSK